LNTLHTLHAVYQRLFVGLSRQGKKQEIIWEDKHMKEPRAHTMGEIWALGATAAEFNRVTGTFPDDWDAELQWPGNAGATATTRWIHYLIDQGRIKE
jgi:hypothetical protein